MLPEVSVFPFPSFTDERELVPASIKLVASAPEPGTLPDSAFKIKGSSRDIRWDHYFVFTWGTDIVDSIWFVRVCETKELYRYN